jgi:hypothetical protein
MKQRQILTRLNIKKYVNSVGPLTVSRNEKTKDRKKKTKVLTNERDWFPKEKQQSADIITDRLSSVFLFSHLRKRRQ